MRISCVMWTLSLNMTGQISLLYHLPTLIGTLHSLKLTTITVSKVIVDVIQSTLPHNLSLWLVSIQQLGSYSDLIS